MAKVRMPAVRPLGGSPRIRTPTRRGRGKTKWSSASPLPRWKRQPSADLSREFAPAAHAAQTAGGEHERGRAPEGQGANSVRHVCRLVSCFRGRAAREVQSIDELPSQHAQSRGQPIDIRWRDYETGRPHRLRISAPDFTRVAADADDAVLAERSISPSAEELFGVK